MNFGQERFQWLEQDPYTREKMPFYMTYPMQNTVFEETEYEKDCKRLQEMYPRDARKIQSMVDEECDLPKDLPGIAAGRCGRGWASACG